MIYMIFLHYYFIFEETPFQIRDGGNNSARPPRQTGGGEGSQHYHHSENIRADGDARPETHAAASTL